MGLNVALALAESGSGGDIFLLEREPYLGHHASTRNSEVIHAGFAYPAGLLKARFCVEGNRLSFELFERLGVPFRRQGKWVVALTEAEVCALEVVLDNARRCEVSGMRPADPGEVVNSVPEAARPMAALFSPTSGIVDTAAYIRALEVALSGRADVNIVYPCAVEGIDPARGVVFSNRGEVSFDLLINAAGIFADDIYRMCGGSRSFEIRPFKGEYYTWRRGTIEGLLYPVPSRFLSMDDATEVSGMGIHLHRSVGGELFVGPTQVELPPGDKVDYTIRTKPQVFVDAVAPMLAGPPRAEDLEPAFAGNRSKLFEDGQAEGDFEIVREGNIIHLMGIESPGLTAAPAIARHVVGMSR